MAKPSKRMLAQKNFLGAEREGFIRRGQAFDTSPSAASSYINSGLAIEMPERPSKADAAAAAEADRAIPAEEKAAARDKKKAKGADENKAVSPSATKGK